MTIAYVLLSVVTGTVAAALVWIESGILLAGAAYVVFGSVAVLSLAYLIASGRSGGAGTLGGEGGRHRPAS